MEQLIIKLETILLEIPIKFELLEYLENFQKENIFRMHRAEKHRWVLVLHTQTAEMKLCRIKWWIKAAHARAFFSNNSTEIAIIESWDWNALAVHDSPSICSKESKVFAQHES